MLRPPARRELWLFSACAVALGAAFVAAQVLRWPEPLGVDQGIFACFARGVPRGALPYRDLFDGRAPLFLYWWAASAVVPGSVAHAAWAWEGLWLAATLALAFALGRALGGRWVGLVAAALLLVGLWSPAWGDDGAAFRSRAQPEEVLALPMMASAWLALRAIERERLATWAGVLAGLCGLVKLSAMVVLLAWPIGWLTTTPGRDAARPIGRMAAGALVPWGLALAWFASRRATKSFLDGVFVYPEHLAAMVHPPWTDVLQRYATTLMTDATLLLVAAAIGLARLGRRGAREVHWAAAWLVATMAGVVAQRQRAGHPHELAIPALAIVGAIGVVEAARMLREPSSRALAAAALGGLALLGAEEARVWWRAFESDAAFVSGRLSRADYLLALPTGSVADREEQAAGWLRSATAPADGILVWSPAASLYALADRHPVTRFAPHTMLLTDAPLSRAWPGLDQRRAAFLEELRRDPPAAVLVGQNDASALEPLDSYGSLARFRELRALLQRDYDAAPTVGGFLVFRRRRGESGTP
jgi:hypothetical protein